MQIAVNFARIFLTYCLFSLSLGSSVESQDMRHNQYFAEIYPITDEIMLQLSHSWREDAPVSIDDLRYIRLAHWGFDNAIHVGEVVVHKDVAIEITEIFADLFDHRFPIEKMHLIDRYGADDISSCADNNTSAFCSRRATGKAIWSDHSFGFAIDINPKINPYCKDTLIIPANGAPFLDRSSGEIGLIEENGVCCRAFKSKGWKWGGDWLVTRGYVDYQHFYKEVRNEH